MEYELVIGLEVHAELQTRSKMFCACPVVDATLAQPNTAVCPVCAGMPGVLPVVNRRAVEYGLRVALALECQVQPASLFARKNYFYPDLPKGYQISQYEEPLARQGRLIIQTSQGERLIRIRRVHLEEDTGKLTHTVSQDGAHSLVDLNRAGVPLLEIVTEPDLHSAEEVRQYAMGLRSLLRYLEVNSGDMQKGVMRIEPNISIRPAGSQEMGTRTEIKNLNSFRALERSVNFELERQSDLLRLGLTVVQETRGWDDVLGVTFSQRIKEDADDYRYFPEPDLPQLVVSEEWLGEVRAALPELPAARRRRFESQYGLSAYDAALLTEERPVADYFEACLRAGPGLSSKMVANWVTGDLFALLNQSNQTIDDCRVTPLALVGLLKLLADGAINQTTARSVLVEMQASGQAAADIVAAHGLQQISSQELIAGWVERVLAENPQQVQSYLDGKETVARWLFGQVMRLAQGQANPQVVQSELDAQLKRRKAGPV